MRGLTFAASRKAQILFLCAMVCWAGLGSVAWAQGFMVKPMKITVSARPGATVTQALEVRNTQADKAQVVDVARWDLSQGANASWTPVPAGAGGAADGGRSCLGWMSLDTEALQVAPQESGHVNITLKVPPDARGAYGAAITLQPRRDPKLTGIVTVVRFLVPVIVEIQGPPVHQRVEIADAGLAYSAQGPGTTSRTQVLVAVANSGESFSRLKPSVKISRMEGTQWRKVWSQEFEERSVLPGQSVTFSADPKRNFPSGKYQLAASTTVDGRPMKPLTKEVDYAGDAAAGPLASNVELVMEPQRVECDVVPGGRRTAYVTFRNPTDEAVKVGLEVAQVEALKGVMQGETKGEDFSAAGWVKCNPREFTLPKNGQRKVGVEFTFPREGLDKAAYYATLSLTAAHPDGQSAGTMQTLVIMTDKKAAAEPRMYGQALSLTQAEKNQYTVSATYANVGGVYVDPSCKGTLMESLGMAAVKSFDLTRDPAGLVLPLGTPRWNGTLDFTGMAPGGYTVKVVCEYGGKSAPESFPVKVTDGEGGQKVVEVIGEVTKE